MSSEPALKVIFQNPDRSINVGLQPHIESIKKFNCWDCKKQNVKYNQALFETRYSIQMLLWEIEQS